MDATGCTKAGKCVQGNGELCLCQGSGSWGFKGIPNTYEVSCLMSPRTQLGIYWFIFNFFFLFNVYLFLRETETECEWVRGRERGIHRIRSRLQAPGSEPSAQSPTRGSNPPALRSWPEPKSDPQPTESPRRPINLLFIFISFSRGVAIYVVTNCFFSTSYVFLFCFILFWLP